MWYQDVPCSRSKIAKILRVLSVVDRDALLNQLKPLLHRSKVLRATTFLARCTIFYENLVHLACESISV